MLKSSSEPELPQEGRLWMDVYIARQPIFDRRMNLFGYELLYRRSQNNFFEGTDDNVATAALLDTSFLVIGFNELTGGTKGFINFSGELLQKGVPLLLPAEKVVVEILERVEPTPEIVEACRRLKAKGCVLALDDFILEDAEKGWAPLLALADIVKVEFPYYSEDMQAALIKKYGKKVTFLAEKVETAEQHKRALEMGYQLFQGYFFSKPVLLNAKDIGTLDTNLISILRLLQEESPDLQAVAGIIESDLGLSYKLLKMANSVYYGARYKVTSIRQALMFLGTEELSQWVQLMLVSGVRKPENDELLKNSIVRGRMLSLMAERLGGRAKKSKCFMVGIFSALDDILGQNMNDIVQGLPLDEECKDALLGGDNEIRRCLNAVLALERADWAALNRFTQEQDITQEELMRLFLQALRWQQERLGI